MDKLLLDSDVLLDFFFDRKPYSGFAVEVLVKCENLEIKGYVTAVIISNVYYLLRQTASHQKVLKNLSQLLKVIDIIHIDKPTILKAIDSEFKDFEDAMQNFAAQDNSEISYILTRNIKDYRHSKLIVMSPETYLKRT